MISWETGILATKLRMELNIGATIVKMIFGKGQFFLCR